MIGIVISSLLVVLAGLLVLWWARAAHRGTLRRNPLFGYRTALTLKDENAWIAVNRASAPWAAAAGAGAILAGLAAMIVALLGQQSIAPVFLGSGLIWLLAWSLLGIIPAQRAARSYKRALNSS